MEEYTIIRHARSPFESAIVVTTAPTTTSSHPSTGGRRVKKIGGRCIENVTLIPLTPQTGRGFHVSKSRLFRRWFRLYRFGFSTTHPSTFQCRSRSIDALGPRDFRSTHVIALDESGYKDWQRTGFWRLTRAKQFCKLLWGPTGPKSAMLSNCCEFALVDHQNLCPGLYLNGSQFETSGFTKVQPSVSLVVLSDIRIGGDYSDQSLSSMAVKQ